jgi:hypothetical protein
MNNDKDNSQSQLRLSFQKKRNLAKKDVYFFLTNASIAKMPQPSEGLTNVRGVIHNAEVLLQQARFIFVNQAINNGVVTINSNFCTINSNKLT